MRDIKQDIFTFMMSNGIMTLSTSHDDKPWSCTVYYGMDEEFNLYIVTDPDSTHAKNIKINPNVAFSIYDSHTKVSGDKKGIQGSGTCMQVKNLTEITKGLMLWHKFNPGVEQRITIEAIKKLKDTRIFKIKPEFLKFFAKEFYPEAEYGLLSLK